MTDKPDDDLRLGTTDALVRVPALVQRSFTQLKISDSRLFPEQVVVEADWKVVEDAKHMRLGLSGYVLADKVAKDSYTKTTDFPFPQSPWQFFKERHQDSWWFRRFVARFPVVYRKHTFSATVNVDRYLSYPKAAIALGLGQGVIAEIVEIQANDPSSERKSWQ